MGEVVPARTSPTLLPHPLALYCHYPVSKRRSASIVVTSTVRVKYEVHIQYQIQGQNFREVKFRPNRHKSAENKRHLKLHFFIAEQNAKVA